MLTKRFVIPAGKVQVYFSFILRFVACKLAAPEDEIYRQQTKTVEWVLTLCNDKQEQLSVSNSLPSMADMGDAPTSPLGATDSTDDSDEDEDEDSEMDDWEPHEPQSFNPHSLCKWRRLQS